MTIIQLFKENPDVLELLGRFWEILYIEGSSPDIGRRRQNVIEILLEQELNLKTESSPRMIREWDLRVEEEGKKKRYSLKTTEGTATVKVAWNGFPSLERARKFDFKHPILYVIGNRENNRVI